MCNDVAEWLGAKNGLSFRRSNHLSYPAASQNKYLTHLPDVSRH